MRSLICTLAMILAGCKAAEPPPGNQYLALGDSYTIGESVAESERWPVQLAKALKDKGIDLGNPQIIARTGWTTDELSAGMDAAKPVGPYRLVTLLIGVNNQFRGHNIDEFRLQFRRLLGRAASLAGGKPGQVIVVSIPDYGVTPFAASSDRAKIAKDIDDFNTVCREESAATGAAFVDITPGSRKAAEDPSLVADDGLHPSAKMYQQWVEQILPVAQKAMGE